MEKKTVLLISLFSVLLIFLVLLKVFAGKSGDVDTSKQQDLEEVSVSENSGSGYIKLPSGQEGAVKYTGKVVPLVDFSQEESYELLDSEGNFIVFLIADDDKLKLAEGRFVEVSGTLEKGTSGDKKVLKVEAVSFR
ncbi:MAG: hypothetical protein ABIB98_00445 [bacterium]